MIDDDEQEIINEFVSESQELLDDLDTQLVELEEDPSPERVAAVFRVMHTIKGTSGLLGYQSLESLTHAAENVLVLVRDGVFSLNADVVSLLLQSVDSTREALTNIGATGAEGEVDFSALISDLHAVLKQESSAESPKAKEVAPEPAPAETPPSEAATTTEAAKPMAQAAARGVALITGASPYSAPQIEEKILIATTPDDSEQEALPPTMSMPPSMAAPSGSQSPGDSTAAKTRGDAPQAKETSVRVDVGLLDQLMNLVGELVLARNQVVQRSETTEDSSLITACQRLNHITSELQEGIMKTRMQPIGSVWTKFPRIVRDLARSCGKAVRLELVGRETELDRTVIEAIRDPLTHIVRNSVDHGIESAEARAAAGKPKEGCILFRAFHEGGMVNIEVSDDGGGINVARVKERAVAKGLVTQDRADRLSDREAMQLLFVPGFSTAPKVTNVSGRGVGMDVVKTDVERIGGTVDISSEAGQGTSIRVKIPLTLAIIPALVVLCREQRYAIPQVNLLELVRVEGTGHIEYVRNTPVYRLRGELLPLVFLSEVLGYPPPPADAEDYNIVVVQADHRTFGLVVDEVHDTQEIVVKPLGKELKHLLTFAGATIMGDGRIALILDVFGISARVGMDARSEKPIWVERAGVDDGDTRAVLIFDAHSDKRMAIPLDIVDRLEEFSRKNLEQVGPREVIQYRDEILQLMHVDEVLGQPPQGVQQDPIHVIVHSRGNKAVGLVVDRISDIVRERLVVDSSVARPGVLGSMILQGRVTEVVDVDQAWRVLDATQPKAAELS